MLKQECFARGFMLIPSAVQLRWMQDLSCIVENNSNSDDLCMKRNPKTSKLSKYELGGLCYELHVSEETRWRT